jgi:hypothetical protein
MVALVGPMTSVWSSFDWMLLFARQPEPDLEFTEEEFDQTNMMNARGPVNPRKKSGGGSPILWILLLALVGGITYVSMEPEMLTEWLSPYLGKSTPPPMAMKPKPSAPAPVAPPIPAPQADTSQSNGASALLAPAPPSAAPVAPSSDPMFNEGQRVTVTGNDTPPGGNISLFTDSSSNKPGPIVRPGVSLTILDGDLQPEGWIYLVRTDDGATGWVSEKRLRLKF